MKPYPFDYSALSSEQRVRETRWLAHQNGMTIDELHQRTIKHGTQMKERDEILDYIYDLEPESTAFRKTVVMIRNAASFLVNASSFITFRRIVIFSIFSSVSLALGLNYMNRKAKLAEELESLQRDTLEASEESMKVHGENFKVIGDSVGELNDLMGDIGEIRRANASMAETALEYSRNARKAARARTSGGAREFGIRNIPSNYGNPRPPDLGARSIPDTLSNPHPVIIEEPGNTPSSNILEQDNEAGDWIDFDAEDFQILPSDDENERIEKDD